MAINRRDENRLKSPHPGGTTHPSLDVNAAVQQSVTRWSTHATSWQEITFTPIYKLTPTLPVRASEMMSRIKATFVTIPDVFWG